MTEVEQREPFDRGGGGGRVRGLDAGGSGPGVSCRRTSTCPPPSRCETKGWLSARTLDNGDAAYEFTAAGETALELSCLIRVSRAAD